MNNLGGTFETLLQTGRKILSVFLTAGYPSGEMTIRLGVAAAAAGADLLEIGIPWSDPLADGPTIQECSQKALSTHTTPRGVFSIVAEIRKSTAIPIILMGYVNPLFSYGMDKFMRDATRFGADGTIIPDLPIEESSGYRHSAAEYGISTIFMVTPTTANTRIEKIDSMSSGFVYAVTVNGVTGERTGSDASGMNFLSRARKHVTRNPLLAGFGISEPATARSTADLCDGVIVGSAVMNRLREVDHESGYRSVVKFISSIRSALDA